MGMGNGFDLGFLPTAGSTGSATLEMAYLGVIAGRR